MARKTLFEAFKTLYEAGWTPNEICNVLRLGPTRRNSALRYVLGQEYRATSELFAAHFNQQYMAQEDPHTRSAIKSAIEDLDIESIEGLHQAIANGRLSYVNGIGPKRLKKLISLLDSLPHNG